MTKFNKRAYGAAVIKSINSNYNADFSHQPRTLPDGRVYATDKALKYLVRNFWTKELSEKVMYYKRLNKDFNPFDLANSYNDFFKVDVSKQKKNEVLGNLLKCIDVKSFGATFAPKGPGIKDLNLSIHGAVQITHGLNQFVRGEIFSEQILSPFSNPGKEGDKEKSASTLGSQSKLREGHYVHGISVNPKNLEVLTALSGTDNHLSTEDIDKLKLGLRRGATYYDSSAKAGTDNELLLWVELKEGSKMVLPSFTELVKVLDTEKREIDLGGVQKLLAQDNVKSEIAKVEVFYNKAISTIVNKPEGALELDL
ncbi:CRISPR-associated protein Csh2 [Algoriphagus ornithinivorans]|uniref:CRISPR-associated protein Csh2 n=1 Tax=Algoriphagus ornithinivorans TaxID=226506 RepID=A0A1I5E4N6_9BACT|nr:type I CRISPR-associated protein Cas7 [Algoriphagus ornithinivorans]SFO06416.1 CRISPR-associated protein Csh2 [Algoriphagus ornithinivorans]